MAGREPVTTSDPGRRPRPVTLLVGLLAVAAIVPWAPLHAESRTICGEKVDFQPDVSTSSATGRKLIGVWEGDLLAMNVSYAVDYQRCVAFAIERVTDDGKVRAKHVAGAGVKNLFQGTTFHSKPTNASWNGELSADGTTLRFASKDGSTVFEFPALPGPGRVEGKYTSTIGNGRVFLKRP
jgi:hypothetical protein